MNISLEIGASFSIPDGTWLLDASTHEGKRYVVVPHDSEIVQQGPTQMDRIESLLATLVELLADEAEEPDEPVRTLDGEIIGGERDDSQPL
ncbi:hypothetical protein [Achromobacter insolitus]|uniref:hypothetical protein n=1 Tax=Achromobacter insolitus TaxID=217204 RepID=UPI0020A4D651|nr:hypothetical protein [Achromobacter insolitus]MCP1404264.1 hypothetical protein [Achromobacter insolitus]